MTINCYQLIEWGHLFVDDILKAAKLDDKIWQINS